MLAGTIGGEGKYFDWGNRTEIMNVHFKITIII